MQEMPEERAGLWLCISQRCHSDLINIIISSKWSMYWVCSTFVGIESTVLLHGSIVQEEAARDEPSVVNRQVIIEEYMDRQLSYEHSCTQNKVEFNSIIAQENQGKRNFFTFPNIPECIN